MFQSKRILNEILSSLSYYIYMSVCICIFGVWEWRENYLASVKSVCRDKNSFGQIKKGIKLALKLDVSRGKLDKGSRKGINFYGFVDKSTCKYAIPFFFCRGNFFFIIAKKTVGYSTIFSYFALQKILLKFRR